MYLFVIAAAVIICVLFLIPMIYNTWKKRELQKLVLKTYPNLLFYQNKIPFQPNGIKIDKLLRDWSSDYERLEKNEYWIYWLFPVLDDGGKKFSYPIQNFEIAQILRNQRTRGRLIQAYRMVLDFFGLMLVDTKTAKVKKAPNWKERFKYVEEHPHHFKMVTRVLTCFRDMGLQQPITSLRLYINYKHVQETLPSSAEYIPKWINLLEE